MLHFFRQPISGIPIPERFTDPFRYTPHPLCIRAAEEVQEYLKKSGRGKKSAAGGKMFGVLVVVLPSGDIGFLAAFSGILDGNYLHPYFVPPVYNLQQPDGFFLREEQVISAINRQILRLEKYPAYLSVCRQLTMLKAEAREALATAKKELKKAKAERDKLRTSSSADREEVLIRESQHQKAEYKRLERSWKERITYIEFQAQPFATAIEALKTERRQRSAALQQKLYEQFRFLNARGEAKDLCSIFREYVQRIPPAGAGECCAPKLLQYAYQHHFHPLAMAEFWWGDSPKTEIRRQGNYYPACKGKCEPILTHMLQGLEIETPPQTPAGSPITFPEIVYEDEWITVINKPAGMLSVPGKTKQVSVYDLARQRYPQATGPLVVHRLDMSTSGLLLIAKSQSVHKQLQHLFLIRSIRKSYIALLDGLVATDEGIICLPLCPDIQDRPRQMVNQQYGKTAITRYQVLSRTQNRTRIVFYPQTGRTHQLRVHAAHPAGLNCPIIGDELYGNTFDRLYLHAQVLEFIHPVSGDRIHIEKEPGF